MLDVSKRLLVIGGPTASGKTALAIAIAKRLNGEIISADSRTLYQGMDIGTAKPEGAPLVGGRLVEGIPYLGLDLIPPTLRYSVAEFQRFAMEQIERLWTAQRLPILVGGTGLYVRAIVEGFVIPETLGVQGGRAELEGKPLDELVERLIRLDSDAAAQVDLKNRVRVERALETVLSTGKSLAQVRRRAPLQADVLQIGVQVPRATLYDRINRRVTQMMEQGLLDEVQTLVSEYGADAPALSSIGYQQLLPVLTGRATVAEGIAAIQQATRQYAKRQHTWWRAEKRLIWMEQGQVEDWVGRWLERVG